MKSHGFLVLALLMIMPLFGSAQTVSTYDYWPTEGWLTSPAANQGMNITILEAGGQAIEDNDAIVRSMVVVRHGYIVYEQYFTQLYDQDSMHIIYSCTKSVTSSLIGIAIEQGHIENTSLKVVDLLPDWTITNPDPRKEDITLEHLLTMTGGFEWSEGGADDDYFHMRFTDDWVQYVIDLPMAADPGASFTYCTGGSHLLSAILNQSTGMNAAAFAEEYLFGPLGIDTYTWERDPLGIYNGGAGIALTPRSMAKFGLLYLNNGSWDGEQIVPEEWVRRSLTPHVYLTPDLSYGYQWWLNTDDEIPSARGYGGQFIYPLPEYDIVVAFTSDMINEYMSLEQIVIDYVIEAVDESLVPEPITELPLIPTITIGLAAIGIVSTIFVLVRRR
jgi:CubicO group peptidase (beta-lactamase class C family)